MGNCRTENSRMAGFGMVHAMIVWGFACMGILVHGAFVGQSTISHHSTIRPMNRPESRISSRHPQNINPLSRPNPTRCIEFGHAGDGISSPTSLGVKSLRDIMDDGPPPPNDDSRSGTDARRVHKLTQQLMNLSTQEIKRELERVHDVSTVALRGKSRLVEALVDARLASGANSPSAASGSGGSARTAGGMGSGGSGGINANHGPDLTTMSASEIKRELQLYGVGTDAFLEKRELEEALLRERRMRMPGTVAGGSGVGGRGAGVTVVPGVGNVKSSDDRAPNPTDNVPLSPENEYIYDETQSPGEQAKLRELQIAYEFERVQSSLPDPDDVRIELESQFGISTRYFRGAKEMAYALAVARVDDALDRQRRGVALDDDGCLVGEDGMPIPKGKDGGGEAFDCLTEEDLLPSPAELVAMEYENLRPWDEATLAEELENQYGIPAKHFMGKNEMAYALAVERVDQAVKEGGMIVDDYEEEAGGDAVMSNEDMMAMMMQEMEKEEERKRERKTRQPQPSQQSQQQQRQPLSQQSRGETMPNNGSVRDSPKRTFQKQEPNPFQKTGPTYQSTPLADIIKNDNKRYRNRPQQRTPLSSEPPLGRQRQQQRPPDPLHMGTVIGEPSSKPRSGDSPSLQDILKGSEQKSVASRGRATTPPPRPKKKVFKTTSARVDDSFRGYKTSWDQKGPARPNVGASNGGRGYTTSWNKGPPHSAAAAAGSGGRKTSRSSSQQQRPFEPAPFTEPGTHNSAKSASSSRRQPKRVPPQTPFTSPVMDGASRSSRVRTSQGPFTPFTEPSQRSTNGKPPPRKRPLDPRGFNIRDTPDPTQPFMGSGAYVDSHTPYAPPLNVEPPPRDPNYDPTPERPFEPAPFMNPQPHAVRTDRTAYPRDKWNRVGAGNAPPPPNGAAYDRQYKRQQQPRKKETKRHKTGASPFDNLKDMFSNIGGKKEEEKEESSAFKSGNVEVLSDAEDKSSEGGRVQDAVEVEVIDAEMWEDDETGDDADYQPLSSAERFSNAWKGGPASEKAPPSPFFATANGSAESSNVAGVGNDDILNRAVERAQELLSSSPEIRAIVTRAQSNPRVQEAVQECMGNPVSFGRYLEDPVVGPILSELKDCIK